jgi:hypothetical protein
MTRRWLLWLAAIAAIAVSLIPSLRYGWTHVATDFPNYYTGAILARKHAPLRYFYDWTWFQRQMNYAGWGMQLGSYNPQPPPAFLPILPLTPLGPMGAKQAWLAINLLFLAGTIWMLARLTKLPAAALVILAMAGHTALAGNFELGQYYVFLLFALTLSVYLLLAGHDFSAGFVLGLICVIKGYGAPFVLYFLWKRRWRALGGMLLAIGLVAAASIAWFGWADNLYYVTGIFARTMAGEIIDPYSPGIPSLSNMIRHAFTFEPDLNPHPLANLPALAFFLQPLTTLGILIFCLVALRGENPRHELAWFVIALLLISPTRAFYTDIVLLLPVALLLENPRSRRSVWLIASYVLLTVALPDAFRPYFLSTWILIALYIAVGVPHWRKLRLTPAAVAALAVLAVAGFAAQRRLSSYDREPPRKFASVTPVSGSIYSGSPAVSTQGLVYESIAQGRYLLKYLDHGKIEELPFQGEAFHPSVAVTGNSIYFELVADGHSQLMRYDRETKALQMVVSSGFEPTHPAVAPDEGWLAFIALDRIVVYTHGALGAIDGPTPVHDVSWFPTGGRLVYSAGPPGSSQIYATTSAGTSAPLTSDSGDHTEPAISPDATMLVYTLERGGSHQIWLRNMGTGAVKQFTEGACNSYSPAWDTDSGGFVFANDCDRGVGLGTMRHLRFGPDFHRP